MTIFAGLKSITLEDLNTRLPSSIGRVMIRQKNNRVVLIGDMFKLNVVRSSSGSEGLRVEIVHLDEEVTGLLGE